MTLEKHNQKVEKIRSAIKRLEGSCALHSKNPSNTLRKGTYKVNPVDISSLNEIVHIDEEALTAAVEPRVTMEQLVNATLKKGLMPLVVPEFKTITVGGAIMGAAIESSSHRFGQFNDTCEEYEIVLGNGEKILASSDENSDLFYALAGSYGTLGILTLAKIRLRKAPEKIFVQYHHFKEADHICSFLLEDESDFLEGYMLQESRYVAVTGNLSCHSKQEKRFSKHWDKWFIDHLTNIPEGAHEMIPTKDYLFRQDRGAFWIGKCLQNTKAFLKSFLKYHVEEVARDLKTHGLDKKESSFLFRLFFGWAFSSGRLYHIWHQIPENLRKDLFFIHDFYAPSNQAPSILKEFQKQTQILPIWLCPVRGTEKPQFLSPHYGQEKYINIGIYGVTKNPRELSAKLENEIIVRGGRKMLYSYCYYTKERFEEIYNNLEYLSLRKKYHASGKFPSLYEKVTSI